MKSSDFEAERNKKPPDGGFQKRYYHGRRPQTK